jgi:histidinol-phosphate aminotransferase
MYRIATLQIDADFRAVPRPRPSFEFPLDDVVAAARQAAVTWLCVPHNPVGDLLGTAAIGRIAAAGRVTVVDAAYAEFAGVSRTELLDAGEDVVVLGTLSKAYGLAGIRVGYALASAENAALLDSMRPPGSISTTSVALARRALEDRGWMEANRDRIVADRADLAARLSDLGLPARTSATNFLLAPVGASASDVAERLMNRFGLVVRTFPSGHPLSDHLRFTVRDAESHDRLIRALERVL